jgi:exodeoxyribonuclease VII small subunit
MSQSLPEPLPFEQALAELEKIVRDLEDGQITLEESLARYEKGVGLLKFCYGQLQHAEQRIRLLAGVDDQGRPIARPFDHTATGGKPAPLETIQRSQPESREHLF